jgi:hypothetical protein
MKTMILDNLFISFISIIFKDMTTMFLIVERQLHDPDERLLGFVYE